MNDRRGRPPGIRTRWRTHEEIWGEREQQMKKRMDAKYGKKRLSSRRNAQLARAVLWVKRQVGN
jgi:hypothetical protein